MTQALVVSVDELRAASRLCGAAIPPLLAEGDPDDPRVDLAALRGLSARGLLVGLGEGEPEPAGHLADVMARLDRLVGLVEVQRDHGAAAGGAVERRAIMLSQETAIAVRLCPGGLIELTTDARDRDEVVVDGCGLEDLVAPDEPVPSAWSVDGETLEAAEDLALDGDATRAITVLVAGGVRDDAAGHWIRAVEERRGATSVTAARRLEPAGDGVEVRDVRWLVDGDGMSWRVESGDGQEARVRPTTADELRQELREMARCAS